MNEIQTDTLSSLDTEQTEKTKRRHRGSIVKRGKRSWRCKVESDPIDGKRQYVTHTIVGTKEMAEQWVQKWYQDRKGGNLVLPNNMTLGAYSLNTLEMFKGREEDIMTEKTRERFEQLLRIHVLPHLKDIKVQDLSRQHLKGLYSLLRTKGNLSLATIRHVHRAISRVLSEAVEDGITAVNVCSKYKYFKNRDSNTNLNEDRIYALDRGQLDNFLAGIRTDESYPIIFLACATGARRGELLGLRWTDINFETKKIRIERAVEETKAYGLRLKIPKTKKSRRTISVDDESLRILKRLKLKQIEWSLKIGKPLSDKALIFPKSANSPCDIMTPHNITRRFNVLAKKAGLSGLKFHSLRHTHATLLLSGGAEIHSVSKRLGHSTPMLTMNVYGHALKSDEDKAASIAANFMSSAAGEDS